MAPERWQIHEIVLQFCIFAFRGSLPEEKRVMMAGSPGVIEIPGGQSHRSYARELGCPLARLEINVPNTKPFCLITVGKSTNAGLYVQKR